MPLSFDAASGGTNTATSLTYSHTVGVGADRILIVGVNFFYGASAIVDDIVGVTYGGVAMTQITKITDTTTNQNQISYLYYLVAPTSGANNVVVSKTSSGAIRSNSSSYAGASQLAQPDAFNQNNVTALNITTSVTTIADNCWVVSFALNSNSTISAGTGTTARANQTLCAIGDNNGAKTPPGSVSMQWTQTPSNAGWTMVMASILPKEAEPVSTSANPMFFSTGGGTLG